MSQEPDERKLNEPLRSPGDASAASHLDQSSRSPLEAEFPDESIEAFLGGLRGLQPVAPQVDLAEVYFQAGWQAAEEAAGSRETRPTPRFDLQVWWQHPLWAVSSGVLAVLLIVVLTTGSPPDRDSLVHQAAPSPPASGQAPDNQPSAPVGNQEIRRGTVARNGHQTAGRREAARLSSTGILDGRESLSGWTERIELLATAFQSAFGNKSRAEQAAPAVASSGSVASWSPKTSSAAWRDQRQWQERLFRELSRQPGSGMDPLLEGSLTNDPFVNRSAGARRKFNDERTTRELTWKDLRYFRD